MNTKLGIKGHPTRGKEIIELLEMMGGIDAEKMGGKNPLLVYYINEHGNINYINDCNPNEYIIRFTLEDFLEKYPFKIGDKVIDKADGCPGIMSEMKWDEDVSDMKYFVAFGNGIDFGWFASDSIEKYIKDMKKDNTALEPEEPESNAIKIVDGKIVDGLEKIHKLGPKSKLSPQYYEKTDTPKAPILLNREDYAEGKFGYVIPNGYEFDSIKDNQIIIRPIKPKYPKTYKECCDVLLIPPYYNLRYHTYERGYNEYATSNNLLSLQDKLNTLGKLLICRDAYWKVAGEEMGLDKPWEPNWADAREVKYSIETVYGSIDYTSIERRENRILVFPTMEIRDTFFENFKHLIEQCKKLL